MRICADGRVWGQNNREAGNHLGILTGRKSYTSKGGSKGNKNPFFGKHHSIETRVKMSAATSGSKCWNWKGGISSRASKIRRGIHYRLWREAVFARDNWTCQECGKVGRKLNAHHIKPFKEYPELRYAIDNGRTLCLDCHKLTENFCRRKT